MWKTLFDPSMIGNTGGKELAIWCRDADEAEVLIKFLYEKGCRWPGNGNPLRSNWDTYKYETVYFVDKYLNITYADREFAEAQSDSLSFCTYVPHPAKPVEVNDLL